MKSENKADSFDQEIRAMRDTIDDIDGQILALISKRMEQVKRVVALKKAHNKPVFHPAREEDLISRLRSQARAAGMDADFIEDLYRVIIRNSRIQQTSEMKQQGLRPESKVLIVGGAGQMGGYFANLFKASGYEVRILSEGDWDHVAALCDGIDLAIISVPIHVTRTVINDLAPHLPTEAILADLTSVKAFPLKAMMAAHNGPVIGLHPLFGPTSATLDKQIVAVTPGRDDDACRWLVEQLSIWGAVIVHSDTREHDEIMDIVQALRHFATFCFGQFLARKNVDLERTLEFSSPIYRLELGMVGRLFAQDSELYSEIIFATPKRREILKSYVQSLNEQLEMLEHQDKTRFRERFTAIADWFGPFSEQAMRESTFIIDKLIERF